MYRGNAYEFIEKLSAYLSDNYGMSITLRRNDTLGYFRVDSTGMILEHPSCEFEIWLRHRGGIIGRYIYDDEQFEDEVYDFVNQIMRENDAYRNSEGQQGDF